jgi:UMF1 family MFS transporter
MATKDQFAKNDRREVFGWVVYDWANSGFSTTVVAALFGEYLTRLAQASVGGKRRDLFAGTVLVTAKSLAPFTVGISVFLQVFLLRSSELWAITLR